MSEDTNNKQPQKELQPVVFWAAGASYGEKNNEDQFPRFIENNIWEDGWVKGDGDKHKDFKILKEIKPNDYIVVKTKILEKGNRATIIRGIGKVLKRINDYSFHVQWLITGLWKRYNEKDYGAFYVKTIAKIEAPKFISAIKDILKEYEDKKMELQNKCKNLLEHSHNIILHGAPGTGKTYLARQIAESMGAETCFVQFHPSYDYTDFVEGLRPRPKEEDLDESSEIGFERKDGLFKQFCIKALKNLIDSQKNQEQLTEEKSLKDFIFDAIQSFYESYLEGNQIKELVTKRGSTFQIFGLNDKYIKVYIPDNAKEKTKKLDIPINDVIKVYNALKENKDLKPKQVRIILGKNSGTQHDSYKFAIAKYLSELTRQTVNKKEEKIEKKNFVFIIDEINRGEMSKIFGELFFSIDPGYRGEKGKISTQYQNLVDEDDAFYDGFYVPENVYIIGTMNDIDRNVESMDFAIRRRFAFMEITAEKTQGMLDNPESWNGNKPSDEIIKAMKNRMNNLNNAISGTEGLSSAYHIGASYFLKYNDSAEQKDNETENPFDNLWKYHLKPLLQEYLRGMEGAEQKLKDLEAAYNKDTDTQENETKTNETKTYVAEQSNSK